MQWDGSGDIGVGRQATVEDRRSTPCEDDPELFFAERPDDIAVAKSLCGGCPLRRDCLAGALGRREPWGVWGGELLVDGVVTRHKRGRGRPRKDRAVVCA